MQQNNLDIILICLYMPCDTKNIVADEVAYFAEILSGISAYIAYSTDTK